MVQPGPGRPAALGGSQPGLPVALHRLVPTAGPASPDHRAPPPSQYEEPEPSQHRRPLRPRQRLLPDVPRRDHDLFERRLRRARPIPGRRAAQQVPSHGGRRRPGPRPARPRDRNGLGRVRPVRGRRPRLPGDHHHDLPGAARPGPRARAGRGAGAPRGRPAVRLPGHRRHVRRDRLDRDARSRRRRVLRDVLRGLRSGPRPGGSAQPPVDHVPGRRVRPAAPRRELDPDVHLPGRPVPIAGRHRAVHARHVPPRPERDRHRCGLRPDPASVADAVHGQARDRSRPGLRRPVHPDVGVLPRSERGRVRHRDQPGPADRVRETTRDSRPPEPPDPGPVCPATIP